MWWRTLVGGVFPELRRVEHASDVMPSLALRSKASIWLQLGLLLALTSCPTSHTDATEDLISLVNPGQEVEHGGRLYWLQDQKDGLCVGEAGMGPCGEANLWGLRGNSKQGYSLELVTGARQLGPKWMEEEPALCLERKNCRWHTSKVGVGGCDRCGSRGWDLEPSGRVSQDEGRNCLVREAGSRDLNMQHCSSLNTQLQGNGSVNGKNGSVTSRFRLAEYRPFLLEDDDSVRMRGGCLASLEQQQRDGKVIDTYRDPESGIVFPNDMSTLLGGEQGRRQVIMGGGAFKFFGINIYHVGLYIDAERAKGSSVLGAWEGMERKELVGNDDFYKAMMDKDDPIKYDRSVYVKLLIPLQAATVKKSLEAEWNMEPLNKKRLLDASFRHAEAAHCCGRGTELIFTWTKNDALEVRLNGRLVEVFESLELAQDLFYQYVCDDPISPQAKRAFVSRYPDLLSRVGFFSDEGESLSSPITSPSPSSRRRYEQQEERPDVRAHKSMRRWALVILVLYGLIMLLTLPGSKRRFQERMQRGGGSMRALALQKGREEWAHYLTRVNGSTNSLVKLAEM